MATGNSIRRIQVLARSLSLGYGDLLKLARFATEDDCLPSLAMLTTGGAVRLEAALRRIRLQRDTERLRRESEALREVA